MRLQVCRKPLPIYLYILPHALADILGRLAQHLLVADRNQKTNGPVNAHLRSATYANKHV